MDTLLMTDTKRRACLFKLASVSWLGVLYTVYSFVGINSCSAYMQIVNIEDVDIQTI